MQAWADLNCSNYNLYFVPLSQAIRLTSWIADIASRGDLEEVPGNVIFCQFGKLPVLVMENSTY